MNTLRRRLSLLFISLVGLSVLAFSQAPVIAGISPYSQLAAGMQITITGTGFGPIQDISTVTFNGTLATAIGTWSDTSIVVAVPTAASTGNVIVTVGGIASNPEVFVVPTSNFTLSGSALNTARALHTATVLENGTVLFAGGASTVPALASELLADAEVYDAVTDTFTPTASLNTPRSNHTATLLNNGQVLIACGTGAGSQWREPIIPLASSELYDPLAGTFTTTGNANAGRTGHTATLLSNGTVLIAGGTGLARIYPGTQPISSAELYNPVTGTFITTGNMDTVHWRDRGWIWWWERRPTILAESSFWFRIPIAPVFSHLRIP